MTLLRKIILPHYSQETAMKGVFILGEVDDWDLRRHIQRICSPTQEVASFQSAAMRGGRTLGLKKQIPINWLPRIRLLGLYSSRKGLGYSPRWALRWQFGQRALAFSTVSFPPCARGLTWCTSRNGDWSDFRRKGAGSLHHSQCPHASNKCIEDQP